MRYQNRVFYKFQELRQDGLNIRRVHNHLVRDTGQLRDLERDRHSRIHESTELVRNLSLFHLHGADLDDLILNRAEARRLKIKDHIGIIKILAFLIPRHICKIVDQIPFHTIDHFKGIILIKRLHEMIRIWE